jgi:arsenite methyltransferase
MTNQKDIHDMVKEAYGAVARKQSCGCDTKAPCCSGADGPAPQGDLGLSCGNPVAFSHIQPGDVVVDLGSGAGRDVFLAAEKTGPMGRAIGVDMTPDMLVLARRNAEAFIQRTGLDNAEFREGQIENLPVDSGSVDLVISNCVINLSPDKAQVFREVFRILKPGGRMVVSDIVLNRDLPAEIRSDAALYSACISGALLRADYLGAIRAAGFATVQLLTDTIYSASQACDDPITTRWGPVLEGAASSITVLAVKAPPTTR